MNFLNLFGSKEGGMDMQGIMSLFSGMMGGKSSPSQIADSITPIFGQLKKPLKDAIEAETTRLGKQVAYYVILTDNELTGEKDIAFCLTTQDEQTGELEYHEIIPFDKIPKYVAKKMEQASATIALPPAQ